jgi:fibronectin-binding autotransporter adhesin
MRDRNFIMVLARPKRSGFVGWLLVLLCLVMSSSLSAATVTWDGGAGTGNWADGTNWDTNVAPVAGDDLVFAGSTQLSTTNNIATADISFNSITFAAAAGAFTLGGSRITLAGNITNSSSNNQAITLPIILNVATSTISTGTTTITMSGIISETGGARAITKSGSGTLQMGINNVALSMTYSGGTTISAGTLLGTRLNNACFGTGAITLSSGSTLWLDRVASANNIVNNGGTIIMDNGFGSSISGTITNNALLSVQAWYTTETLSGNISGAGGITLTQIAGGTLSLSGTNSYSGATTVSSGTLRAGSTSAFGTNSAVTLANTSTAILDITGFSNSIGSLAGGGASGGNVTLGVATLTVGGDGTSTLYDGVISGTGAVTKAGAGTQTLTRANTYTGATTVSAGTLQIGNAGTTGALSTSSAIVDNATLTFNRTNTITQGTDFKNVISGSGAVIQKGAGGTLVLNGSNTYTGTTSVQDGTLSMNTILDVSGGASAVGAPTTAGNGTIALGSTTTTGTLVYTGTAQNTNRVINLAGTTGGGVIDQSGTGLLKFTSALTATGAGAKTLTLQGSSAGTGEISAAIVDSSSATAVTKTGTNTWSLSGTNTYTGATTVSAGSLLVTGSLAAGSAVAVNGTGTLGGTGTVNGTITMAAGGTIAPGLSGVSIGTLLAKTTTMHASSIYSVDLSGASSADLLSAAGQTVTCAGTLTVASNASPAVGNAYTIISAGTVSGTFSGLANNAVFAQGGRLYRITYTATTVTVTDVAPVVSARGTMDANGNGKLDRIRLTFDQNLNDDVSGLTVTVAGYTVTGFSTGTANDAIMDVLITELGSADTGAIPLVRITANTSLKDAAATTLVQVEGSGTAATDTAKPVLLSALYVDGGTNGVSGGDGDTVVLTFSENVTSAAMVVADLTLPVSGDTLSTSTIANKSTATPTITVALAGTPLLSPGNTYASGTLGAGKPSGIYLSTATHLSDQATAPNTGLVGTVAADAVDIGASPSSSVSIEWNDTHDTVNKIWTLSGVALSTSYVSSTYTVHNIGYLTVALATTSSNSTSATTTWTVQPAVGADQFTMKADASTPLDAVYELTLSTSATTLAPFVRSGTTQDFKLQLSTPTTSSTAAAQAITVTITASQY